MVQPKRIAPHRARPGHWGQEMDFLAVIIPKGYNTGLIPANSPYFLLMIVCNLTKPEATLDQVRKTYPKLKHTDAANLAVALVISGKYALAHYDDRAYVFPTDVEKLTKALSVELHQIQETLEPLKKKAIGTEDDIPVELRIGLSVNAAEGEKLLGDREDLKTLLADTLEKGVEFQYGPTDVLWQWAMDRANWGTVSGGDLTRKIKLKSSFTDNTLGTDLGATTGKRKTTRKVAAPKVAEVEAEEAAAPVDVDVDEAIPEA